MSGPRPLPETPADHGTAIAPPPLPPRRRDAVIDLLRALSILWIVGFWHLLGYAPGVEGYKNGLTHRLTVVVLGLFVLIAGHLIGRAGIHNLAEVASFYRRRLVRIYPPYLLALLLFALGGLLQLRQLPPAAVLVSSFGSDPPDTLWYIAMLVVFYLLAPFLLLLRERLTPVGREGGVGAGLAAAALLILLSSALGRLAPAVDPRLFLYFPPFVVGLLITSRLRPESFSPGLTLLVLALGVAGMVESLGHPGGKLDNDMLGAPLATLVSAAVLLLGQRLLAGLRLPSPLMAVSTASYFMYLFHRPLYEALTGLGAGVMGAGRLPAVLWLVLVCLPLIVAVSWWGQKRYDALVKRLCSARTPDQELPGRA